MSTPQERRIAVSTPTTMDNQDRESLAQFGLQLRRLKRRLFLASVKQPENNVDKFRSLMLQLAMRDDDTADMTSVPSNDSLPSIYEEHEETSCVLHEEAMMIAPVS